MLVLSRREQETILIGDDIKITIVRVKGHVVRIGIDAPTEYQVLRGELIKADLTSHDFNEAARNLRIEPSTDKDWKLYFEAVARKQRKEISRLKAINAELLEACEDSLKYLHVAAQPARRRIQTAITKAKAGDP